MFSRNLGLAVGAALLIAIPAQAATFSTEASYNAANTTTNLVTFGGIASAGNFTTLNNPFVMGNVSITSVANAVSSSSFSFETPNDTFFVNAFGGAAGFTFANPVTAFGFRLASGFDGGLISAVVFNGATSVGNFTFDVADQNAFTGFFGANGLGPITSVTLTPESNEFLLVDQIQTGAAIVAGGIPEPATWAMMILGFGFVGGAMRFRKRSTMVRFANA